MKYSEANKPLQCMQTQSTCYKNTTTMEVKGVLWHSTGANNPTIKRYVQPSDNDPDREKLLAVIGKNVNSNDWNHIQREAGLNCWIGQLADGTVATVQTMPWNYAPWGCGGGSKGSCNNGWIQFEICEDGLTDADYFSKVYREACEITAYLCQIYGIDPHGTVTVNGVKIPTILCHNDSYQLGFGSGHADVTHWFPKFGKSMATARDDVAALIAAAAQNADNETIIWDFLKGHGLSDCAAAGIMGNLYAESGLNPQNLQNTYEKSLGYTDAAYTAAVDAGTYANFVHDSAGYGLAQWTYWSRKEALLTYAKSKGKSIGDLKMQLEFLVKELTGYGLLDALKTAASVREASDLVLLGFEKPADQSEAAKARRAGYGQIYCDKFANQSETEDDEMNYYKTLEDVPSYYRPTVEKLVENGALKGTGKSELNVSDDFCRIMTVLDRLGKLD